MVEIDLEERIAHLERSLEELSAELARRARDIDALSTQVKLLAERDAARAAEETGGVILGDERPPHW